MKLYQVKENLIDGGPIKVEVLEETPCGIVKLRKLADGDVFETTKESFEKIYDPIPQEEKKNTVTQVQIDELIENSNIWYQTIWDKCTLVACQLPNGFIITESSAYVDSANYDADLGYDICIKRIKNKIWELEGYNLQSRLNQ